MGVPKLVYNFCTMYNVRTYTRTKIINYEICAYFLIYLENKKLVIDTLYWHIHIRIIIIYSYFTGKLSKFYFKNGAWKQFRQKKHPESSEGWFVGKIGQRNPWLRRILISRKSSCSQYYRFFKWKFAIFLLKLRRAGCYFTYWPTGQLSN